MNKLNEMAFHSTQKAIKVYERCIQKKTHQDKLVCKLAKLDQQLANLRDELNLCDGNVK